MRTRFLGTDFFNSAPIETLGFLHLSPPILPPSCIPTVEDLPRCLDHLSVLESSLGIEKLPIETSLNKFFSDVLPQPIHVQIGGFEVDLPSGEKACSREPRRFSVDLTLDVDATLLEKNEIFSDEEGMDDPQYDALPGKEERISDVKVTNDIKIIQFEVPEIHPFSVMDYDFHCRIAANVEVFSEISHVESESDMPDLKLRRQDFFEIQQAICSVDSPTVYFMEQTGDLLEDSTGGQLDPVHTFFPVFEIEEESLVICNDISVGDKLKTYDNIECQTWIQEHKIPSNEKELLESKEFDLLLYLSNHCPAVQCPEVEITCSNFFQEIDFISDYEDSDIGQLLLFHQGITQDALFGSRNVVLFEALEFTGIELYSFVEVFYDLGRVFTTQHCDLMFSEAMKFKSFNDLIVSNELILVDESFKSLPVPILSDSQKILSLHSLSEKMLSALEPESSSSFDGLYLDWHVLEEDNSGRYLPCWRLLEEIDTYRIDYTLSVFDNRMLVLEFLLSGDSSDEPNLEGKKEISDILLQRISVPPISHIEVSSKKLGNDNHRKVVTKEMPSEISAPKVHISVDSITYLNAVDCASNPRECAGVRNFKPSEWSAHKSTAISAVSSGDSIAAKSIASGAATQVQKWNIKIIPVELSHEFLVLIENFRRSYMDILQNDTVLMKSFPRYQDQDGISCLRLKKEDLIDQIKKPSAAGIPLVLANDNIISLVALCAIKQMAWYICYYGLHPTQLYMNNLSSSLPCLKSRLSFLHNLIEDMCRKAEREITKSHPSLSVVQNVMKSHFNQDGRKVLIVAEPIFWMPLKRLLNSMGISYHASLTFRTNISHQGGVSEFSDAIKSDCSLVAHECLSASFPFEVFGIILEYGGSHKISRVCNISVKQDNCPCLYFLKVELEDLGVPKAICEGVDMPKIPESITNGGPHFISLPNVSNNKIEELLNFVPIEENCKRSPNEAIDDGDECCVKHVQSVSLAMESDKIHMNKPSCPDRVIVVNTHNFDKEMVISRRSTYQKILALEKEGAQVVERDLNLPVDVVVNAAICLAWYDLKNIGKKASASDESLSSLALCVENIAASILTSLSYAFSSCILVFEGDKTFLTSVVESSDELYAAAASLGIDFQMFCSYSSVMTDDIILSCIEAVTKVARGLYPRMPDSESLAESFLTTFPSINPLAAHGILSSGGLLVEFLEWPHDRRVHAVQKYKIPEESVGLLGFLCQYGEREDSKSGMTDSSSSVSYPSDRFQLRSTSEARKRKYIDGLQSIDVNINESSPFEPHSLFSDVQLSPPRPSAPISFWMSENSEIVECEKHGLSFDNKGLGKSTKASEKMMMNSSKVSSSLYGFEMGEGPSPSEEWKKHRKPWNNEYFVANQWADMAAWNKTNRREHEESGYQLDLVGEVIDTDVYATFRKDISTSNSSSFFPHEVENNSASGISRTVRKLSFGRTNFAPFSTRAEIDSNSDAWINKSNTENSSSKVNKNAPESCFNSSEFLSKHQKGLLHNDKQQKTILDSCYQSMQKTDRDHFGRTPLWNAVKSSGSQQGRESPWTIEFLSRIKEKSKAHQQFLPCGLSPPCFGSSGIKSNARKRRSPSILEYFKYQRDGVPRNSIENKRQKQSLKPSLLYKNQKVSNSVLSPWTPVDKRAKRTLSFSTTGNGGQSKLIWSDKSLSSFEQKSYQ